MSRTRLLSFVYIKKKVHRESQPTNQSASRLLHDPHLRPWISALILLVLSLSSDAAAASLAAAEAEPAKNRGRKSRVTHSGSCGFWERMSSTCPRRGRASTTAHQERGERAGGQIVGRSEWNEATRGLGDSDRLRGGWGAQQKEAVDSSRRRCWTTPWGRV